MFKVKCADCGKKEDPPNALAAKIWLTSGCRHLRFNDLIEKKESESDSGSDSDPEAAKDQPQSVGNFIAHLIAA